MTVLDVIILIVLVGSLAYGFWKGMIVQAGALAGILLGILACRTLGLPLARVIATDGAVDNVDLIVAKVILFVIAYLGVRFFASLLKRITHALAMGALDRLAGMVFSFFQWMLVLSILLNLWFMLKPTPTVAQMTTLGNGHLGIWIVSLAPKVLGWAMG